MADLPAIRFSNPAGATMRVGFIGGGQRGRLFAGLMSRHSDVEVVGVYDPSEASAKAFADATSSASFGTAESLMTEGLEAVVVATPDHLHLDAALAAVQACSAVLVEKPLATSASDARQIRDAAVANGCSVSLAYLNRWHPAFARVLQDANTGAFGRVLFQNARLSNSVRVPTKMLGWAAASSPGWFLMPHSLDLVTAIAPRGRTTVRAVGHRGLLASRGVDTWDGLQAVIGFMDGSSALVESLWVLPENLPSAVRFGLEVIGESGMAVVDDSVQGIEEYGDSTEFPRVLVGDVAGVPSGPNVLMLDAFVQSLRDGVARLPDADDGLWVTQIIEAIHTSADERVDIGVEPDDARVACY